MLSYVHGQVRIKAKEEAGTFFTADCHVFAQSTKLCTKPTTNYLIICVCTVCVRVSVFVYTLICNSGVVAAAEVIAGIKMYVYILMRQPMARLSGCR